MVACNVDSNKMTRTRRNGSSVSSGFRLLDADQCDTISSVSRNSIYKLKIDSMFDDSKSIKSHHIDDRTSQHTSAEHKNSIRDGSTRSSTRRHHIDLQNILHDDVQRVSNTVQAQIERMFSDVAKDATSCSFPVRCLGSLPLKDKVTSLVGLQEPLRQLYLSGLGQGDAGHLEICATGLRVRLTNGRDANTTSFHNIAVWSAVKFIVSTTEGGAAFLPLITDPENIDKSSLFRPLSAADKRRLSSGLHAPIFAVVMRSAGTPRQLECHGFVCQSAEDAIVIAATLYQSLMTHMGTQSQKARKPRNQNGVSCISIASSSIGNNQLGGSTTMSISDKINSPRQRLVAAPSRPPRKKRSATSSLSGESDIIRETANETSTDERKKKSHKTKRAPPVPDSLHRGTCNTSFSYIDKGYGRTNKCNPPPIQSSSDNHYPVKDQSNGDIFTRVAIPRSGSFLNTSGLTRYKSRATRRAAGKTGGGGGRSPLGFSELFNEFRLQENLHSLDDILNAIINSDGMSFNDLKPIYKEFLLKLAVTLTKDELYQRSKIIMRRQKKKKLRRKNSNVQNKRRSLILGSKGLKKIFWFGKFRTANFKKLKQNKQIELAARNKKEEQIRAGTSSSDVSDPRNEHTLNGQNRNSSSGYVSCSECSYDSEACTCASADRCYCSLGADHEHVNARLHKTANRDSLFSCHTEDKCYCSLSEENANSSVTTWCDTESCISTSKCYCKHVRDAQSKRDSSGCKNDKLALDYELFTVGSGTKNGKPIKATEALSVKKSVEVAALFAGAKLSQTTDITSIGQNNKNAQKKTKTKKHVDRQTELESDLKQLNIEQSLKKHLHKSDDTYQPVSVRPVGTSLEDSLGYLP